jgi:segregation and condensation protein B
MHKEPSMASESSEFRAPIFELAESPPAPKRIVEALLFVGGSPLTPQRAGEIVRHLTPDEFEKLIDELNRDYRRQRRPYQIETLEHGYVLKLKSRYDGIVERLAASPREARLTDAALQVLALIAYRQPIGKADIDGLRGQDSRSPLHQLVRLGLVAVQSRADAGSKETGYVTTARFLELFELRDLDDLPKTGDLQRI